MAIMAFFGILLSSCAAIRPIPKDMIPNEGEEVIMSFGKESISKQMKSGLKEGLCGAASGHLLFTVEGKEASNEVILDDASLKLRIDGLFLQSIALSLHAPISYGNNHFDFDVNLAKNASDESCLYFSVDSLENEELNHIRYKANLSPYFVLDEDDNPVIDENTGGVYRYSYGNLDWLIHDIASILTGEGSSISAPAEEESSFSMDGILDSLEDITQTTYEAKPYFVWSIPLGDKSLPIGLSSDASYNLKGIDLPAKTIGGDYEISDALSVSLSLSLEASSTPLTFGPIYPEEAYHELRNSAYLFEKVATLISNPQFGLSFDGTLHHYVEESYDPNDPTSLKTNGIDELLALSARANIDFSSATLNGFDGSIELGYVENDETVATQEASFYFDAGEGGEGAEAYFQINHVLMAKATKTVLDAFIGDLVEAFGKINIVELLFGSLKDAIENLLASAAIEGIKEGTYDEVVPLLERIECEDNLISITLNGEAMSLGGQVKVTLDGRDDHSLVSVTFIDFCIDALYINGVFEIADFVTPCIENPEDYQQMAHLRTVEEQVVEILQNESASLDIEGHFYKLGVNEKDVIGEPQGFTFSGRAHIDVPNKRGAGNITFTDRKEDYRNDHHVKINVQGPEGENEEDNYTAAYASGLNNMIVTYDSQNDSKPNGQNRTDPSSSPLSARFSMHSLNSLISTVKGLMDSDDDRITRLFQSFSDETATDLISSIASQHYFNLFKYDLIEEADIGSERSTIKIPGSLLGQSKPLEIEMEYYPLDGEEKGIKSLTILAYIDGEDEDGNDAEREIYIKISSIQTPVEEEGLQILESEYASNSGSFTDFSSLALLVDYLYGSMTLGETDTNKVSTYQLEGTIAASLGSLDLKTIELRLYAYVNGANVKLHAQLTKIPIISGLTDSGSLGIGAVTNVLLNQRQTDIFFCADGGDAGGKILLMRKDVYSKVFWKDTYLTYAAMTGKEIQNDIAGWLVTYALGINMDAFASDTDKKAKSPHAEDIIESFSYSSGPTWNATIDLGAALDTTYLTSSTLSISGITCTTNNGSWNTLNSISGTLPIHLLGLDILNLNINLSLKNVTKTSYSDGWTSNSSTYTSNFNGGTSSYARNPLHNGSETPANHYKENKI